MEHQRRERPSRITARAHDQERRDAARGRTAPAPHRERCPRGRLGQLNSNLNAAQSNITGIPAATPLDHQTPHNQRDPAGPGRTAALFRSEASAGTEKEKTPAHTSRDLPLLPARGGEPQGAPTLVLSESGSQWPARQRRPGKSGKGPLPNSRGGSFTGRRQTAATPLDNHQGE